MLQLISRIGADFGIACLVSSHLLGELERVSNHVVVLDGGRLLRASATDEFTDSTGTLLVEVLGDDAQNRMGRALVTTGIHARPRGRLIAIDPPPGAAAPGDLHDRIRDLACETGVGLVRLQPDHRRIEDVFHDGEDARVGTPN